MGYIFVVLLSLFGLLSGLFAGSTANTQITSRDTERKTDINVLFSKLEEHYSENGDYPSEKQLLERGSDIFPGIDPDALVDPNDVAIYERGGEYGYAPDQCAATGCQTYSLSVELESGEIYSKSSLN